ncbi:uncharacterized protein LOC144707653 [Wolffia australiana]
MAAIRPHFSLIVALWMTVWATAAAAPAETIHDLLKRHGLPPGILPKRVRSFSLDRRTGLLIAQLDGPCYALWRDNPVFYDKTVAGNLSFGELNGVVGLAQEELFLWLPVKGVVVPEPDSGVVLLDIGVAHKQLSLSIFEDPPDCRPARHLPPSGIWRGRKEGKGWDEQR